MRKSLFSLLGLIALWSLFYAWVKYFFWGVYADGFSPTLEGISGYVLIGSMIAYIIGGPLYARLSERFMLFVALLLGIVFFIGALFLPEISPIFFNISMAGIGLAYSLYVIGKNTLIGREIATSELWSATIWAFTTVIFIIFLVIGTVIGSKIGETKGLLLIGALYFVALLLFVWGTLFFINTRRETSVFRASWALYKKLFYRYAIFMIGLACFWQISVEASQVAINYSKDIFAKSNAVSSLLLLFSSVGAIIGNIISVKFSHKRLQSFSLFSGIFIVIIFGFSSILDLAKTLDQYAIVQGLAFLVWLFFGWAVNLSESYFYSLLWDDPDKDYTSALYGFMLSFVGAIMMFISEKILHTGSYGGISIFLWFLAIIALYGGRKGIAIKQ